MSAAPTGKFFAISEMVKFGGQFLAEVTVFTVTGELVWQRRLAVQEATIRWSPDGSRLVIDARLTWLILTLGDGPPTVHEIVTARPRQPDGRVTYPWMLIGFSEDGRWLYGADETGGTPWFRPAMRVAAAGGPLQPVRGLPVAKGARLAFPPTFDGSLIQPAIDPLSGSIVSSVCAVTDACRVNVWRDRTAVVFDLPTGSNNLDIAWDRGSLIGIWRQTSAQGATTRLSRFDAASRPGAERRITSLPASPGAALVGLHPGFVLVALGSGVRNATQMELVLVRLSDGARSVVRNADDSSNVDLFTFAGWLPATH